MPAGPIRFGKWLFRLFAWDSLLPVVVVLIPALVESLFPNRQGFIETIAIVLPIVAFFIRLRAGRRHIVKNNCTRAFRSVQFIAFFLAIFILALLDGVIVLSYIMPAGALFAGDDNIIFAWMAGIYLALMTFAMYPGREWSRDDFGWQTATPGRLIEQMLAKLGEAPRHISWWRRYWHRPFVPLLARGNANIMRLVRVQDQLLQDGMVVWGAVIRADRRFFKSAETFNCGYVDILYSPDRWADDHPLSIWPQKLFRSNDSTSADQNVRQFADLLAGKFGHLERCVIPNEISNGRALVATSMIAARKHLPNGKLSVGFLPILVDPDLTTAMIVPVRYWPEALGWLWCRSEGG